MNSEHAVQHSLNVSRVRVHINKPVGTRGLTPTPAYFDIVPACYDQNQELKDHVQSIRNSMYCLSIWQWSPR